MAASEMKLGTTCWTMPACSLEECAGIAKALGLPALDIGYFYASALDKQRCSPIRWRCPRRSASSASPLPTLPSVR